MNEKNNLFSATGIPSLFLIFGVLMLVILSLLGYGTSRQDQSASTLSLEQTTAYYDACTEATDFYTDTLLELQKLSAQAKTENEYYQLVGDYFNKTDDTQWDSDEHTVQYVKAFSATQSLVLKMLVLWSSNISESDNPKSDIVKSKTSSDTTADSSLAAGTANADSDVTANLSFLAEILSWNTVVTADWNPDNSQSVYKGE